MRKFISILFASFLIVTSLVFPVSAGTALYTDTKYTVSGFSTQKNLSDYKRTTYTEAEEDSSVTLNRADGIAHIYIEFDRIPNGWSITSNGKNVDCGKERFLHDYIDVKKVLGATPETVTLNFPKGTVIADIYAFSSGDLPDFVQIWNSPCEKADLLLISSHSDDEQLFFAGILPYYAIERDLNVQVAYIVQHFEAYGSENHVRPHEQLDGLWKVGIKNYPVMSDFPDLYSKSTNRETAFKEAEKVFANVGVTFQDFKEYITENLRRFKPLVTVSHDLNGEYGHGTHVLCAAALTESIKLAKDSTQFPESAEKYGVWEVEKTYLHLYDQNKITMDWDTPLESLGGKTPFQVTQEGFGCHKSQHWTWFNDWIYGKTEKITTAKQITKYSPCKFGLYDSKVGLDTVGGDFMENITTYKEREEAEKIKAEQEALKKAEEEKKIKAEEEAKAKAESERKAIQKRKTITIFCCAVVVIIILIILTLKHSNRNKGSHTRKRRDI